MRVPGHCSGRRCFRPTAKAAAIRVKQSAAAFLADDAEGAKEPAKRTLTNLYNQRPAWLANAHRPLDEAVFAAYGRPTDLSDDQILAKLLELNLAREPAR